MRCIKFYVINPYAISLKFVICVCVLWSAYGQDYNLGRRCGPIAVKPLTRLCNHFYPRLAKILFSDGMAMTAMPYAIYRNDHSNQYFVSHGQSPLTSCTNLIVQDQTHFVCDGASIILPDSKIHCLVYRFRLVDMLVEHCHGKKLPDSNFVAMHYVNAKKVYPAEVVTDIG